MTTPHELFPAAELPPGERRIVDIEGRSIGVFNVAGDYYAVRNVCPHQRAPLCEGTLTGLVTADEVGEYNWERDGCVIRCPWHGWGFDVRDGDSVFNPHRWRVSTYETEVRARVERGDEDGVETYPVDVDGGVVVVYV